MFSLNSKLTFLKVTMVENLSPFVLSFKIMVLFFNIFVLHTSTKWGYGTQTLSHLISSSSFEISSSTPNPFFLGGCALTPVHIINRLPSLVLSFKTPFELLYTKPPFFSHLRVFGCLAYATNIPASHKFNHCSIPSLFISYPIGQKAYKLFDLSTKKIFTSHDVRFHKNISPCAFVKPNYVLSPSNTNSGPIPLVAHDTFFLFHFTQSSSNHIVVSFPQFTTHAYPSLLCQNQHLYIL
jgi:hypothetical protein